MQVLESLQGRLSEVEVDLGMEPLEAAAGGPNDPNLRLRKIFEPWVLVPGRLLRNLRGCRFPPCCISSINRGPETFCEELLRPTHIIVQARLLRLAALVHAALLRQDAGGPQERQTHAFAAFARLFQEFFSTCLSDLGMEIWKQELLQPRGIGSNFLPGNRGHPVRIVEILRRRCNAALAEFYWLQAMSKWRLGSRRYEAFPIPLQADAPVRTHTDQLDS